ncbi:MAG: hypothetical protein EPN73_11715 [Paraburkholderia sp.]|uniref:hypothetical protein n=1 Tax=Paraburkholderia sp. TaxID=1926495 RepID=UPI0012165A5E|nr:hypothetical protein [Paraburkholderia sp.]TAL95982.1 MAG: hypothetical protein EPN73_11715 [Paraburkholderia sp.]
MKSFRQRSKETRAFVTAMPATHCHRSRPDQVGDDFEEATAIHAFIEPATHQIELPRTHFISRAENRLGAILQKI